MRTKKLFNNSSVDVKDFRIEEAEIGEDGGVIRTNDNTGYKTTGRTLEWSIKAGEKLEFPEYVANYLMGIFGFLEEYKVEKLPEKEKEPEVTSEEVTGFKCKFCGKVYDKKRALSMHMGTTHADELANL